MRGSAPCVLMVRAVAGTGDCFVFGCCDLIGSSKETGRTKLSSCAECCIVVCGFDSGIELFAGLQVAPWLRMRCGCSISKGNCGVATVVDGVARVAAVFGSDLCRCLILEGVRLAGFIGLNTLSRLGSVIESLAELAELAEIALCLSVEDWLTVPAFCQRTFSGAGVRVARSSKIESGS